MWHCELRVWNIASFYACIVSRIYGRYRTWTKEFHPPFPNRRINPDLQTRLSYRSLLRQSSVSRYRGLCLQIRQFVLSVAFKMALLSYILYSTKLCAFVIHSFNHSFFLWFFENLFIHWIMCSFQSSHNFLIFVSVFFLFKIAFWFCFVWSVERKHLHTVFSLPSRECTSILLRNWILPDGDFWTVCVYLILRWMLWLPMWS